MAIELLKPMIYRELERAGIVTTIRSADTALGLAGCHRRRSRDRGRAWQ
jgi:DNA-binding transcriptional regulator YhcF (GntR family)